jgi:hypothetical protein
MYRFGRRWRNEKVVAMNTAIADAFSGGSGAR